MKHLPKYIVIGILVLLCLVYLFSRCSIFDPAETAQPVKKPEKVSVEASDKIKGILEDMTLEEKLYQMFYVTPEQLTETEDVIFAGETTKKAIDEKNVGGIVYAERNLQDRTQAKELLKNTQEFAKIPMFLGTTEEGGQKFSISRNSQMSLGEIEPMGQVSDADSAYAIGEKIGEALKELGLNMNFAPVADVMAEGKFNMIGDRSFGYDKDEVSRKVEWIIKGLKKGGVAVTLKHFPGMGSTEGDTNMDYPLVSRSLSEIKSIDLAPFKAGIDGGADFVMIGHIRVPELDADNPATFSEAIVTDLLREEMGYGGVIITSPLNEGAVLNSHTSADAAVEAVLAGVDMLYMPNSLEIAHEALFTAVKSGRISEERINESVIRILNCKEKLGIL